LAELCGQPGCEFGSSHRRFSSILVCFRLRRAGLPTSPPMIREFGPWAPVI
jgi:hypothetical protein